MNCATWDVEGFICLIAAIYTFLKIFLAIIHSLLHRRFTKNVAAIVAWTAHSPWLDKFITNDWINNSSLNNQIIGTKLTIKPQTVEL